jgi:hypothetical protein
VRGIVGPLRFVFVEHAEAIERGFLPEGAPPMTVVIAQDDEVTIQLTTPGNIPEELRPNALDIAAVFSEMKSKMRETSPGVYTAPPGL